MAALEEQCMIFLSAYLSATPLPQTQLQERGGGISKQPKPPNQSQDQIIAGITSYKPERPLPQGLIPDHLPDVMKSNIHDVNSQQISDMYNIENSLTLVSDGTYSRLDVIHMYLCSFKNILEYELNDHQVLHERFLRYFNRVFTELIDRCLVGQEHSTLVCTVCMYFTLMLI